MKRFNFSELDGARIVQAMRTRGQSVRDHYKWRTSTDGVFERHRINARVETNPTRPLLLAANGPTLASLDASQCQGFDVMTLNRGYLHFGTIGVFPRYHVTINPYLIYQFGDQIVDQADITFLPYQEKEFLQPIVQKSKKEIYFPYIARSSLMDRPVGSLMKPLPTGGTVTFVGLQLAALMGYRHIVLIGVDHAFHKVGNPNSTLVVTDEGESDHFTKEYFPPGTVWQAPDLLRSEKAYQSFVRWATARHIRVRDCTEAPGSPVFKKSQLAIERQVRRPSDELQ